MRSHVLVRDVTTKHPQLVEWAASALGHNLLDLDMLEHDSTFTLQAFDKSGPLAYLPIQQPLMLESFALRPDTSDSMLAIAMTRLVEHALSEAYRRDAGEVYFLCLDQRTSEFAQRHHFTRVNLPLYRFNRREFEEQPAD